MKKTIAALAVLGASFAAPALAETPDEMANGHFEAIAAANVGLTMSDYADDAVLYWIGGPLDGVYVGESELLNVWSRFTGAQGELGVEVSNVRVAMNPAGATVTADVVFMGERNIPVRYVLVYRNGELVSEIWQIAAMREGY